MGDEPRQQRASLFRRLGPASVLGILWASLPALAGIFLLSQIGVVQDWLTGHETLGLALYVAAFAVTAGFGLLPTYAQAVLGGWVFGLPLGGPAALAGFTGGAVIGYGVTRFVARDRVTTVINEHPKAGAIREALVGRGFFRTLGTVALLRLPPNSPFALTNLVMAGSAVPLLPFTLGTLIGMTPRTVVAVAFAAAAAEKADDIQSFVKEGPGLTVFIVGIVVMFVVLAIIGHVANRAIAKVVGGKT